MIDLIILFTFPKVAANLAAVSPADPPPITRRSYDVFFGCTGVVDMALDEKIVKDNKITKNVTIVVSERSIVE